MCSKLTQRHPWLSHFDGIILRWDHWILVLTSSLCNALPGTCTCRIHSLCASHLFESVCLYTFLHISSLFCHLTSGFAKCIIFSEPRLGSHHAFLSSHHPQPTLPTSYQSAIAYKIQDEPWLRKQTLAEKENELAGSDQPVN